MPRDSGPPFFVVGSARSGTTLLRVILNSHSEVAVPPESRFVVELWEGRSEIEVERFLGRLAEHQQFNGWALSVDEVRAEIGDRKRMPYAGAVAAAYEAYAKAHGRGRWGDKTPRYVESIPLISKLFPECHFVHLVRDGRNVALSYAGMPFGPKTVPRAAALWARRVETGMRDGRPLGPDRYLEIRYEDLVSDLETHVRKLCDLLELSFDESMLHYTDHAQEFVFEKAARYNPHVMEGVNPQLRSWEEEMPDAHVEMFEAIAGDVLDAFDYPRRYPNPGPRARLAASMGRLGVPLGRLTKRTA